MNRAPHGGGAGRRGRRCSSLHQMHSTEVVVAGPEGWTASAPARRRDGRPPSRGSRSASSPPIARRSCSHDPEAGVDRRRPRRLARRARRRARGDARPRWRSSARGARAIRAVVGPTISQRAYEVGPEFLDRFLDEEAGNERFFAPGRGDRLRCSTCPASSSRRLRGAGVADVAWIGACTYSDAGALLRYRRTTQAGEPDYGRLISAIALTP